MKKILVTGHKGVLGSNIIKFIEHKKEYKILFNFKKNEEYLKKLINEADIIINCVGEYKNKKKFNRSNNYYVKKIIKFLKESSKKKIFIHFSSCSVYESHNKNIITNKTKITTPSSLYARTKFYGDEAILDTKNIKFYIIRIPQILGSGLKNSSLKKLKKAFNYNLIFLMLKSEYYYNYILLDDILFFINKILNKNINYNLILLSRNIKYKVLIKKLFYKKEINLLNIKIISSFIFLFFLKTLVFFRFDRLKFVKILTNKKIYISSEKLSKKNLNKILYEKN